MLQIAGETVLAGHSSLGTGIKELVVGHRRHIMMAGLREKAAGKLKQTAADEDKDRDKVPLILGQIMVGTNRRAMGGVKRRDGIRQTRGGIRTIRGGEKQRLGGAKQEMNGMRQAQSGTRQKRGMEEDRSRMGPARG